MGLAIILAFRYFNPLPRKEGDSGNAKSTYSHGEFQSTPS